MRAAIALAGLLLLLGGGCDVRSKLFCAKNPDDSRCTGEGGVDAPAAACGSAADCVGQAGAPACDTSRGACVACVDNSTCAGATPTCGSDDACRACAQHADCDADACLDDGTCAAPADVAYVAPGGGGSACTQTQPCVTAVAALATGRPVVRVTGRTVTGTLVVTQDVTFLGDPGSSQLTGSDPITFEPQVGALTIDDLTLTSSNGSGVAVRVVSTTDTPTVTLARCTLTGNPGGAVIAQTGTFAIARSLITTNAGGGLLLGAMNSPVTFRVINNFIVRNGSPTSAPVGGANLFPADASSKFEFNTVVDNFEKFAQPLGGGVFCVGPMSATNNLVARNAAGSTTADNTNLVGTCGAGTSILEADPSNLRFVADVLSSPGDYHIQAGSVAIDAAAGTDVTVDFDGDPRPSGSASDLGADELP